MTAALVVAQCALLGYAVVLRSPYVFALGEVLLLPLAAAAFVVARYAALRREFRLERSAAGRLAERQRIADDVHDLVGHDLSLIALQAGLLQLRSAEDGQLAGEIRARAEQAVVALHDSIGLLTEPGAEPPAPSAPPALIEEFRAAGGQVTVTGSWDDARPATVRLTASRVLREALTNAARHAPGRPVAVDLGSAGDALRLRVHTEGPDEPVGPAAPGRGLSSVRRRVEALGGSVVVSQCDEGHELVATIPADGRPPAPVTPGPVRPARRLLRQVAGPAVAGLVVVLGFYTWASHGTSLEPAGRSALSAGMPAAQARLPGREAPVRLLPVPAHPAGWRCRLYTDGNFPLATATTEVCLAGGRVVRVTDLTTRPPW